MIDTLFRFRDRAARSTMLSELGLSRASSSSHVAPSDNVDDTGHWRGFSTLSRALGGNAPWSSPCTRALASDYGGRWRVCGGWPRLPADRSRPLPDFIQLMANAGCVLTDSGGIQEESTALEFPCLTLRATTERPVTVSQGTNRLVGVDGSGSRRRGPRSVRARGRRDDSRTSGTARRPSGSPACSWPTRHEMAAMEVRTLQTEDADWDAFVHRHPDGSPFHLTAWRRAVRETFGHTSHYLMAKRP